MGTCKPNIDYHFLNEASCTDGHVHGEVCANAGPSCLAACPSTCPCQSFGCWAKPGPPIKSSYACCRETYKPTLPFLVPTGIGRALILYPKGSSSFRRCLPPTESWRQDDINLLGDTRSNDVVHPLPVAYFLSCLISWGTRLMRSRSCTNKLVEHSAICTVLHFNQWPEGRQ